MTSGLDKKKCHEASTADLLCVFFFFLSSSPPQSLAPCPADRHVYDNVGLKGERHIYENVGELRDATPDLILAVKPKVPLEDEQVTRLETKGHVSGFSPALHPLSDSVVPPLSPCLQFMGADFGDDKASASDSSSRLSCVDRAERNSRALSLHNSITKSKYLHIPEKFYID